jgi:hypothetical protein
MERKDLELVVMIVLWKVQMFDSVAGKNRICILMSPNSMEVVTIVLKLERITLNC